MTMKPCLILALILVFSFPAYFQSARVSVNTVLRGTPNSNGKIVEILNRGVNLEIIKEQDSWLLVQTKYFAGWVLANKLELIGKSGYKAPFIENKVKPERVIKN